MSPFIASLFGVITGTFGGAWVYLLLRRGVLDEPVALWTAVACIVIARLVAVRWNLRIPATPA